MNPLDQQSKYTQDEQRRRTQAENKVRELEERIEELEAEVERLRKQRDHYEKGLHDVRGRASKLLEDGHDYGGYHSIHTAAQDYLENKPSAFSHE